MRSFAALSLIPLLLSSGTFAHPLARDPGSFSEFQRRVDTCPVAQDASASRSCIRTISKCGTTVATVQMTITSGTQWVERRITRFTSTETETATETLTGQTVYYDPSVVESSHTTETHTVTQTDLYTEVETSTESVTSTTTYTDTTWTTPVATTTVYTTTTVLATGPREEAENSPPNGQMMFKQAAPAKPRVPTECSCLLTKTVIVPPPTRTVETHKVITKTSTVIEYDNQSSTLTLAGATTIINSTRTETTVLPSTITQQTTLMETMWITERTTTTLTDATQTVTETVLVTETIYPEPDVSCGNAGIQFAFIRHGYTNGDGQYSSFQVDGIKAKSPTPNEADGTGVSTIIGGLVALHTWADRATWMEIYGKPRINAQNLAVIHRGYLYAPETGSFEFSMPAVDDITLLWVGEKAYNGWVRENADVVQPYVENGRDTKTFRVFLTQGEYVPIRIVWGNGQTDAKFDFTIKGPNGDPVLSSDTGESPYLVQFGCGADEQKAPKFAPWSQEQ